MKNKLGFKATSVRTLTHTELESVQGGIKTTEFAKASAANTCQPSCPPSCGFVCASFYRGCPGES